MAQWVWDGRGGGLDARAYGRKHDDIVKVIKNPRGMLIMLGNLTLEMTAQSMKRESDPVTGRTWKRLSPVTIARKGHSRRLVDSGALAGSYRKGGRYSIWRMGPTFLIIGTSRPWASIHQKGSRKIPQRRHLGLSRAHKALLAKSARSYVMKRARGQRG